MSMNVDRVRESVMDDPRQSLRLRAASLNLNKSTVHRIISKDLHFQSKVYNPLPPNLNVLKQRITEEINAIPRAMLQRVIENFSSRLNECEQANGAHLQSVVFHK